MNEPQELREQIAEKYWLAIRDYQRSHLWDVEFKDLTGGAKVECLEYADQILSLPLIEQAKNEERERIIGLLEGVLEYQPGEDNINARLFIEDLKQIERRKAVPNDTEETP